MLQIKKKKKKKKKKTETKPCGPPMTSSMGKSTVVGMGPWQL